MVRPVGPEAFASRYAGGRPAPTGRVAAWNSPDSHSPGWGRLPSGQPPHESQSYASVGPPPSTCTTERTRPRRSMQGIFDGLPAPGRKRSVTRSARWPLAHRESTMLTYEKIMCPAKPGMPNYSLPYIAAAAPRAGFYNKVPRLAFATCDPPLGTDTNARRCAFQKRSSIPRHEMSVRCPSTSKTEPPTQQAITTASGEHRRCPRWSTGSTNWS